MYKKPMTFRFNSAGRVIAMEHLWERFEKANPSAAAAMQTHEAKACAPALLDMYQAVVILHLLSGVTSNAVQTLIDLAQEDFGPPLGQDATLQDLTEAMKHAPKMDGCESVIAIDSHGCVMRTLRSRKEHGYPPF